MLPIRSPPRDLVRPGRADAMEAPEWHEDRLSCSAACSPSPSPRSWWDCRLGSPAGSGNLAGASAARRPSRAERPDRLPLPAGRLARPHVHGQHDDGREQTTASLSAGGTTCLAPGDKSGYWVATMYNGASMVTPAGPQVIYYKTGVLDYTSVRPFPRACGSWSAARRRRPTSSCTTRAPSRAGSAATATRTPTSRPAAPVGTRLNVRMQTPSCWNGRPTPRPERP